MPLAQFHVGEAYRTAEGVKADNAEEPPAGTSYPRLRNS